jgi:DNA-directed RNA polymerase specialized sigma24 family protein
MNFGETRWSVVNAAAETTSPQQAAALETLCNTYWFPIYVYVRRRGYSAHDAQDLTQDFFARIVRDNSFARADRSKGKFRSYLLGALNHFLADEWDKKLAKKRGGGQTVWSLEAAEEKYLQIPASNTSPETAFDHRWGLILLEQAVRRLHEELKGTKKEMHFALLKDFLTNDAAPGGYEAAARKLSVDPNRVAVIVYRMRRRFRQLLRAELAQTVSSQADLDEELRHLFLQ